MYNLTSRQAKGFLATVKKHMGVFQSDAEFGWTVVEQDVREFIKIRTNKYDCCNTVKSFPCALSSSDATIDSCCDDGCWWGCGWQWRLTGRSGDGGERRRRKETEGHDQTHILRTVGILWLLATLTHSLIHSLTHFTFCLFEYIHLCRSPAHQLVGRAIGDAQLLQMLAVDAQQTQILRCVAQQPQVLGLDTVGLNHVRQ
jgi:hypothetical protein